MSVFAVNVLLAVIVAALYVFPCAIQWSQSEGEATRYRVWAVVSQALVVTVIIAALVGFVFGMAHYEGLTLVW